MRAAGGLVVDVIDVDDDGLTHDVVHGNDADRALDRPDAAAAAARFRRFVHSHLVPGLAELGFDQRPSGVVAAARAGELAWLLDIEPAPWSIPDRICFTVAWGVHVPGLERVLDDPVPPRLSVDTCPVRGRIGQAGEHLDPTWFTLRQRPWTIGPMRDGIVTRRVMGAIGSDLLPKLSGFTRALDVQASLAESLAGARGAPSADELRAIRRVAAISALVGQRDNALRWLDYLEARTELAMTPEKAKARVAELRERCLAS